MSIALTLRRRLPWFLRRGQTCAHVIALDAPITPSSDGCEECLESGGLGNDVRKGGQ